MNQNSIDEKYAKIWKEAERLRGRRRDWHRWEMSLRSLCKPVELIKQCGSIRCRQHSWVASEFQSYVQHLPKEIKVHSEQSNCFRNVGLVRGWHVCYTIRFRRTPFSFNSRRNDGFERFLEIDLLYNVHGVVKHAFLIYWRHKFWNKFRCGNVIYFRSMFRSNRDVFM